MSDDVSRLQAALSGHPGLRDRLATPGLGLEEAGRLLREAGLTASPAALAALLAEHAALDDAQLDGIAGGWQLGELAQQQPIAPGPITDIDDFATITP
ncbi:toxin-antitoxin system protein [Roseomonas sp. GC11]|uniref:toxin-antitoxin system protein n=1 Tax=Roseomonas sp. GC11 TaxID=2950546 RepID=UPI00210BC331|nr:toxin-antitoxin system protein [Roseomonas sp. GC11]MCQ4161161.1 toxin-antitoxin system protein [Roseomonas sp. GC11]